MKGTLMKTDKGWMVNCNYSINKNDWETLPLHPEFIEMMDTCFTSKFSQEVEFEMVTEDILHPIDKHLIKSTYAKLIHHPVDTNKMIDHIGEANEIVEDDVEKLTEEEYPIFDGDLLGIANNQKHSRIDFIKGYNKAKETLYTKQDIIDSVNRMYDIFMDDTLEAKKLRLKGISWHIQNTLESLKQPKKD